MHFLQGGGGWLTGCCVTPIVQIYLQLRSVELLRLGLCEWLRFWYSRILLYWRREIAPNWGLCIHFCDWNFISQRRISVLRTIVIAKVQLTAGINGPWECFTKWSNWNTNFDKQGFYTFAKSAHVLITLWMSIVNANSLVELWEALSLNVLKEQQTIDGSTKLKWGLRCFESWILKFPAQVVLDLYAGLSVIISL